MKREIKFRAWDKTAKAMVIIAPPHKFLAPKSSKNLSLEVVDFQNGSGGDEYELMQYTGLKDRNGTEIYEGDIIKNTNKTLITSLDDDKLYLVEWQNGEYDETDSLAKWLRYKPGFIFKKIHEGMVLIFEQYQIEVIGNIFENPELLKP